MRHTGPSRPRVVERGELVERPQCSMTRTSATSQSRATERVRDGFAPELCLVTRIRLRKPWHVLPVVLAFRRMRRSGRAVAGLLDAAIAIRPGREVVIVTLWADETAIGEFATAVPDHLALVRWTFRSGATTWSCLFEAVGVSHMTKAWTSARRIDAVSA